MSKFTLVLSMDDQGNLAVERNFDFEPEAAFEANNRSRMALVGLGIYVVERLEGLLKSAGVEQVGPVH